MSCNPITFNGCEIAGTTFEGRTLKISGVDVSGAKFSAKILSNFGRLLKEIPGIIQNDAAYFSFTEIESFGREKYRIEYWAEIPEIGTEVIAVEYFKIVGAGENGCGCGKSEISANVIFEKKEIAVSLAKSVVQISQIISQNLDFDTLTTAQKLEIKGDKGDAFKYTDFTPQQLQLLKGVDGQNGINGTNGQDGQNGADGQDAVVNQISVNASTLGLTQNSTDAEIATALQGYISDDTTILTIIF